MIDALDVDPQLFDNVLSFDPPTAEAPRKRPKRGTEVFDVPVFLRHDIPKRRKTRGARTVWEPLLLSSPYKALARRLGTYFKAVVPGYPHESVFGFRTGRNIRENASAHAGHAQLLSLDIQDFFSSITVERIDELFRQYGVPPLVADLLSRFVTIGGRLPAGLPTSPVLSNVIALPIDVELDALARRTGSTYTRYVDDISFSGDGPLPELSEIEACLQSHGFAIAPSKTRRSRIGQAHYVTGLSISDPLHAHVPRKTKRELRQQLHYAAKFGLEDHLRYKGVKSARLMQHVVNSMDGMVKFVAHHEPKLAPSVRASWTAVLSESRIKPSFEPKNQSRLPFDIFIDEAEFERGGAKVLALGLSVSQHQAEMNQATVAVLARELGDLFAAGKVEVLRKKGLHYADATEDLRRTYVSRLSSLPFEGYVALAPLGPPSSYETTYIRLLGALMPRRLMAAESRSARIHCEKNSKVSQKAIERCVLAAYQALADRNDRRPKRIQLAYVDKPNAGISVPDFLLGVLGRYLQAPPRKAGEPEPRDRLMFERLRDKYRLILDLNDWTEYSRRRPIAPWCEADADLEHQA